MSFAEKSRKLDVQITPINSDELRESEQDLFCEIREVEFLHSHLIIIIVRMVRLTLRFSFLQSVLTHEINALFKKMKTIADCNIHGCLIFVTEFFLSIKTQKASKCEFVLNFVLSLQQFASIEIF